MVENEPTPQQQRELLDKLIEFAHDAIHRYREHSARDELLTVHHLLNLAQHIDSLAWLDEEELRAMWPDLLDIVAGLSGEYWSVKRSQAVEKAWELAVDQTAVWFNPLGRRAGPVLPPNFWPEELTKAYYQAKDRRAFAGGSVVVTKADLAEGYFACQVRTLNKWLEEVGLPQDMNALAEIIENRPNFKPP
jgi:hypothetical protein